MHDAETDLIRIIDITQLLFKGVKVVGFLIIKVVLVVETKLHGHFSVINEKSITVKVGIRHHPFEPVLSLVFFAFLPDFIKHPQDKF